MLFWFVRLVFILLGITVSFIGVQNGSIDYGGMVLCVIFFLLLGLGVDLLISQKNIAAFAGIILGVVIGLFIGLAFGMFLEMILETYKLTTDSALMLAKPTIVWVMTVLCCYWSVTFVMKTKDSFKFIIPYVEFSKQSKGIRPFVLDSSVIIDGRIVDIASTKIFNSPFIVPRFIINELQTIADSADKIKRNRGRRGLDMVSKLQENPNIDVEISDIDMTAKERTEPTDLQLVTAARRLEGKLMTNDYNLNKVATVRGIEVININELAKSVKIVVIPGEELDVYLVKAGDQQGQAVGYLDDGTMVVVENGRPHIGTEQRVMVTSALQTSAGRMVFAKCNSN